MELLLFWFFSGITFIASLGLILTSRLYHSLFYFFAILFCVAGFFVFAGGDFPAVVQIIVYVGGVLILLLFGIMLTGKTLRTINAGVKRTLPSLVLAASFFAILISMIYTVDFNSSAVDAGRPAGNMVEAIGIQTVTGHAFTFELTGIFLLLTLVAAAYISRRRTGNHE